MKQSYSHYVDDPTDHIQFIVKGSEDHKMWKDEYPKITDEVDGVISKLSENTPPRIYIFVKKEKDVLDFVKQSKFCKMGLMMYVINDDKVMDLGVGGNYVMSDDHNFDDINDKYSITVMVSISNYPNLQPTN